MVGCAMPPSTAPLLELRAEDRAELERMARSESLPVRTVVAARGLVMLAEGAANIEVARRLAVSPDRVRRWRERYLRQGAPGLGKVAPGRGRKPSVPDATVAEIVRLTREERPA